MLAGIKNFMGGLIAALAVALLLAGPAQAVPYRDYAQSLLNGLPGDAQFRPDLETVLANLANAYRSSESRAPLQASQMFQDMARAHAADMMLNNFMGHRSSTGHDFAMRLRVMKPDGLVFRSIAENAAADRQKGAADAAKARRLFQQWIDSRSHRKALLNNSYSYVSSGVVQRGNAIWAVQIFWGEPLQSGGGGFFQ